jgi:TP901 family phage tail tape measure protein
LADTTSEIKLVISGNAESAERTISNVSKLLADMSESMTRMAQRFVDAGKVLTEFGSTIARTGEDVSMASSRLTRLGSNVARQAERISTGAGDIVKSLDAVPKAAEEAALSAARSFALFNDAQSGAASLVSATTDRIRAETDALRAQTEATKTAAASTRQYGHDQMLSLVGLQMLGDQISRIAGKGLELFTGAIKEAIDFQASMDRVKAALLSTGGATEENIQKLGQVAQKLDQTTIFSVNDITNAMQDLAKQGITFGDLYGDGIHNAISATTTLAQATDTDLRQTATVIGDVMNEFAIKGKDMVNVVNSISGAMHVSRISMEDFYNAMKYAGPQAHNLGMDVRDVAAAIGLLAERGIKGSQAGTTLRRMFQNLEPHTKAAIAEFKQLGLITKDGSNLFFDASGHVKSMGEVIQILQSHLQKLNPVQRQQALNTMFGTYALSGMTVIASTTADQWNKLTKAMGQTNAQDVAAEKINIVKGHIKILQSSIETLGVQMATFLLPAIDKVVLGFTRLANWFQNLSPHAQHTMFITFGIVAALFALGGTILSTAATIAFIMPGLQLLGSAFMAIGRSMTFLLGPWGLVIAAVVTGVTLLITYWTQVNNWMQQHFGVTIPQILHALLNVFETVWNAIKNAVLAVWNYIAPTLIAGVRAVATWWRNNWDEIRQVTNAVWTAIKALAAAVLIPVFLSISAALSVLSHTWNDIWHVIATVLKTIWDEIVTIVKVAWHILSGYISVMLDIFTGHWSKAWTDIKQLGLNLWNDIKDGIVKIATDLKDLVIGAVKALVDGVLGLFDGLWKGAQSVWNGIKSIFSQKLPAPSISSPASGIKIGGVPAFAEGGIVTKPTIALVGEAGPEMIIPMKGFTQSSSNYQVGLPSTPTGIGRSNSGRVVNITGPIMINTKAQDARGIARDLKLQLQLALQT